VKGGQRGKRRRVRTWRLSRTYRANKIQVKEYNREYHLRHRDKLREYHRLRGRQRLGT
jgi:hypothetical protein